MVFPLPLPAGTDTHIIRRLGATSYTAPAITFSDDTTFLTSDDTFGTPSAFSYSFWFCMDQNAFTPVHNKDMAFFQVANHDSSDGGAVSYTGNDDWTQPGYFNNYWPDPTDNSYVNFGTSTRYRWMDNQWHHVLCAVDGSGLKALYVDDVLINDLEYFVTDPLPGTYDWRGAMQLPNIGGPGTTISMADVWIAPDVNLMDDNGLIPEATRRQFISSTCQPVDPSNFPEAAVIFSGDSTTFGTNQGTGGTFTLTGSLTDSTAGSPSAGARVQIDGLKGGVYNVMAAASAGNDDWTGTHLYILSPVFGYNVTRVTFSGDGIATPGLANSVVFQMYGPKPVDISISRIQNTTTSADGALVMMLTEDTVFEYAGGCGTNGTFLNVSCADWGGNINIEPLHPNGTWLPSLQTFAANGSTGITMGAGTYRIVGLADLNAPLAVSITPINMNSTGQSSGIAITEVSEPFSLSGGVYGFASYSDDDATNPVLNQYMPDGSILPRNMAIRQAYLPYLPGGTYTVDPTVLSAPLTYTLAPVDGDRQVLLLNGITEDTEFVLEGCPLEWQAAVTCADWNDATVTLEYQLPDGSWSAPPNGGTTASENTSWWPTSPSGTYRITGVSDLNAPLYVGFSNTSYHSTDSQSFTINGGATQEFSLQGGQYAMTYFSYNNGGAHWSLNFQSPDGSWVNINSFNDGPQFTWQWYAAGRYQIDASALDNRLQVSFMGWPL